MGGEAERARTAAGKGGRRRACPGLAPVPGEGSENPAGGKREHPPPHPLPWLTGVGAVTLPGPLELPASRAGDMKAACPL